MHMTQHATAATGQETAESTLWFGLGKTAWTIFAVLILANSAFVLAEYPNATGVGTVLLMTVVGYAWIRFLKFVLQKLGVLS